MGAPTVLKVRITGDAASAIAAGKQVETTYAKLGGILKGAAVAGAAVAGAAIIQLGRDAIRAASDVQQSMGALDSVFGANAAVVKKWATGAATAVGLSKAEYGQLSATLGAQLKNMDIPLSQLAGQTDSLVKMGADLAATFGGPTSEAVAALSSLLRGETDPIERYGVSIKAADVAAKAVALGLASSTAEVSKNATAQASLALLSEQTAIAQGAFGREADTAAGAQARASAQWENAKAILGEKLLPAFTAVTQFMSTAVIPAFLGIVDGVSVAARWIGVFASAVADYMQPAVTAAGEVLNSTVVPAIAATVEWLEQAATWAQSNADVLIVLGVVLASAALSYNAFNIATTIGNTARITATAVTNAYRVAITLWNATALIANALTQRGTYILIAQTVAGKAAAVATKGMAIAQRLLNAAMRANPIGIIITIIMLLVGAVILAYQRSETFRNIVQSVFRAVKNAVKTAIDGVVDAFNWCKDKASSIWDSIERVVRGPIDAISGFIDGLIDSVKSIIDWFGKISIPDWLKSAGEWVGDLFSAPTPQFYVAAAAVTPRLAGPQAAAPRISAGRVAVLSRPIVRVYIGDTELKGIVRTEVRGEQLTLARRIRSTPGRIS